MPLRRDSSVSIATRYKPDGPRTESRWRPDLPHPSRTTLGPIHRPAHWAPCLFLRVKRPGRGVKKLRRHRSWPYSLCEPLWSVLGWNLPLPWLLPLPLPLQEYHLPAERGSWNSADRTLICLQFLRLCSYPVRTLNFLPYLTLTTPN
jgi:hypothetical protein